MSLAVEEWRPAVGFEGWVDVSNMGRARRWYARRCSSRRLDAPELIRPSRCGSYEIICVRNAAGPQRRALAAMVLEAFVGPRPGGNYVCHFPDQRGRVSRLDTIRWDRPGGNGRDAVAHASGDVDLIQRRLDELRRRFPHLTDRVRPEFLKRRGMRQDSEVSA